jgi:hypothetical protein
VHGRGDNYGVYGVAGSISPANAPDFSPQEITQPPTENPFGVMGVSPLGSPAIVGDCNVLQKDLSAETRAAVANLNAGVVGLSQGQTTKTGDPPLLINGIGVVGLGQFTFLQAPEINSQLDPTQLRGDAPYAGVARLSGLGAGVYGFSSVGRGGTFAAPEAAQISLVPNAVRSTDQAPVAVPPTPLPILPGLGQAGDIIAISLQSAKGSNPILRLWFCFQSGNQDSGQPAQWAEITLGQGVSGVLPPVF